LYRHLQTKHSHIDRLRFASRVNYEGFDAPTGDFLCPSIGCDDLLKTQKDLLRHFTSSHLVTEVDHFQAFLAQIFNRLGPRETDPGPLLASGVWWVIRSHERSFSSLENEICEYCFQLVKTGDSRNHLLGLLVLSSQLEAIKDKILKTIPQFALHPMFDAILPVKDCRFGRRVR
jgi:hypothetical protein